MTSERNDGARLRFRFGDCELDLATRQLTRGGEPVALEPRVFDLIAFLLEERHRAVDKDAIQAAVWHPAIVSETALTRAIMKARRAVGDDAGRQSVIRTVHGHGYQFVALLAEAETGSSREAAVGDRPARTLFTRVRWLLLAAVLVLGVGVALLWRAPPPIDDVRVAVLPVVNATGDAELDWAKFGLMGLANEMFADTSDVDTVSASDVVRFVENTAWSGDLESADAESYFARLQRAYGASHVLAATLERSPGGLRLSYRLVGVDGLENNSTMVSERGTELVRGMVHGVSGVVGKRRRTAVSTTEDVDDDPFINEAFARAMGLAIEGRCKEAGPLFDVVLAKNPEVVRALFERAACLYRSGDWAAAEQAYVALLERPDVQGEAILEAEALGGLGTVYHRTGRLPDADRTYTKGIEVAEAAGDRIALARLLTSMAILAKDRRNFTDARALLARATLAYRQLEWQLLPGQIPSALANIAMNDGKYDEAEGHLDDALVSFRNLGDRRNEAMMLNNYGFLRRKQGRFDEAEDLHLESLAIRRDIGDRVGQGRILGMLSIIYANAARHAEARDAAAEALAIAREANDRLFVATGLAQLAAAERSLGNRDAARTAFLESRDIFLEIEDVSRASQVDLRLARLDVDAGQLDVAAQRVDDVLERTLAAGLPEPAIEAMEYAGDIAVRLGDTATALRHYEDALAHIEASGFTTEQMPVSIKLAALYLDREDLHAAEPLLGYVVEQEQNADSFKLRARYAHLSGDHAAAVSLMEQARALAKDSWSPEDADVLASYRGNP